MICRKFLVTDLELKNAIGTWKGTRWMFVTGQSASWLIEPECLLIGWARVPPDWSSQSASWLVEPESLLIVCTRVPPDWSSQSASWLAELQWILICWSLITSDWSRYGQASIFSNMTQTDIQTDRQTRATSRDASASKNKKSLAKKGVLNLRMKQDRSIILLGSSSQPDLDDTLPSRVRK